MLYPIELVIFDCDGVLVDSEYLSSLIVSELLTKAGHAISASEVSERYSGLIMLDILKRLEKQTNSYFSLNIAQEMHKEFAARMVSELQAIKGAHKAVAELTIPYCIGSNSSSENLTAMLKLLDLYSLFEGRAFSAQDVGTKRVKPDPNVFLFAAETFNVKPEHCLVIEDSVHGIAAAKAANMRIVGFTGGSHSYSAHNNILVESGAETVYSDHQELPLIIQALTQWKDN